MSNSKKRSMCDARNKTTQEVSDERYEERRDTDSVGKSGGRRSKRKVSSGNATSRSSSRSSIYTGHNDISWYCKNRDLLNVSTQIPFSYALGSYQPITQTAHNINGEIPVAAFNRSTPGIMTLDFIPRWSKSTDGASALSLGMRNNYAYVRSKNSGAKNYDPADLFLYTGAVDSLYMFYATCVRILGVLDLYNPQNSYVPVDLATALGFDFDDFIANRVKFQSWVMNLPARIGVYVIPGNMDIVKRHWYLCSEIYMDTPNAKSNLYAFTPVGFYQYDPTNLGRLRFKTFKHYETKLQEQFVVPMKVDEVISYGEELIQALWLVEDAMTMSGDIQKAWDPKDWISISQLSANYAVSLKYDDSILLQIEHATAWGMPSEGLDIYQNPNIGAGYLVDNLSYSQDSTFAMLGTAFKRLFLNGYSNAIGPDEVMYMTRLMTFPYWDTVKEKFYLDSYGSEVITRFHLLFNMYTSAGDLQKTECDVYTNYFFTYANQKASGGFVDLENMFARLSNVSQFDRHPIIYPLAIDVSSQSDPTKPDRIDQLGVLANIDNFAFMDADTLRTINRIASLTLMHVDEPAVR